MKNIFVINGTGESGKDTFIEFISKFLKVKNVSSVDNIKQAATVLGWDGSKDNKSRKFLSDMKMLSIDYNDNPFTYIQNMIEEFYQDENDILFIHIREPKEITRIVKKYGACTIIVKNPRIGNNDSNSSDYNVDNYKYDFILKNDGDLADLENKAKGFAEYLLEINRFGGKE